MEKIGSESALFKASISKIFAGAFALPPHIPPLQLKFWGKLGLPPRGVMIFTLYKPLIMLKNCCFHLIHRTKWTGGLYIFHFSKKREKKGKIREDRKKIMVDKGRIMDKERKLIKKNREK